MWDVTRVRRRKSYKGIQISYRIPTINALGNTKAISGPCYQSQTIKNYSIPSLICSVIGEFQSSPYFALFNLGRWEKRTHSFVKVFRKNDSVGEWYTVCWKRSFKSPDIWRWTLQIFTVYHYYYYFQYYFCYNFPFSKVLMHLMVFQQVQVLFYKISIAILPSL